MKAGIGEMCCRDIGTVRLGSVLTTPCVRVIRGAVAARRVSTDLVSQSLLDRVQDRIAGSDKEFGPKRSRMITIASSRMAGTGVSLPDHRASRSPTPDPAC